MSKSSKILIALVILILLIISSMSLVLYGSIVQPVSNSFITYTYGGLYDSMIKDNLDFNMNEYDFLEHVKNNYWYKKDATDCKFYSMLWYNYFNYHDWNNKFVYTDNHVFIVAWKDSTICIADIDTLDCSMYSGST